MKQVTFDITSETPELTFSEVGIPGPRGIQGIQGIQGEPFRYSDFTPEQLASLKGEKGDSIKGDKGDKGIKGDKGDSIKGDKGDPLTYSAMTDDEKEDLRAPLRTEFTSLVDTATQAKDAAEAASTAAQVSSTAAQDSLNSIGVIQADITAKKAAIDSASASVTQAQVDVANKQTSVQQLASQVSTEAASVASDKITVEAFKNTAEDARDEAVQAASTATAALAYEGVWDASTGSYPAHKNRNGLWKVTVGGIVNGVVFKTGEELIYHTTDNSYTRIPSTSAITSVNGHNVGDIILTAADVGALGANAKAVNSNQLDGHTYSQVISAARSGLVEVTQVYDKGTSDARYLGTSGRAADSSLLEGSTKAQVKAEVIASLPAKAADSSLLEGKSKAQVIAETLTQTDAKYLGKLDKATDSSQLEGKSKAEVISEAQAAVALDHYSKSQSDSRFLGVSSKASDSSLLEGYNKARVVSDARSGLAPYSYTYSKGQADGRFLGKTSKASSAANADALDGHPLSKFFYEYPTGTGKDANDYWGKTGIINSRPWGSNGPTQHGTTLLFGASSTGTDMQMFFDQVGKIQYRMKYGTQNPTAWGEVYSSFNKPTPTDIGALPVDGQAKDSAKLAGHTAAILPDPNTIPQRDGEGNLSAHLFKSAYPTQSAIPVGSGISFRVNSGNDTHIRFATVDALKDFLGTVHDSTLFAGKSLATVKAEARGGLVPDGRKVNNKRLDKDIVITKADVGLTNVPDYAATNAYSGTSTSLLATQKAAYDAAAAPRLEEARKRLTTISADAPTGGSDGDIWLQY